jgi:hypothetical protein
MARAKRHFIPGYIWHTSSNSLLDQRGESVMGAMNTSGSFIQNVNVLLGFKAKGRKVIEGSEGHRLRDAAGHHLDLQAYLLLNFVVKNEFL